jgi:hypothetical protein
MFRFRLRINEMTNTSFELHILLENHVTNIGRLRCRSSSPGRVKNFLFSKSPRPALGSTQPPIQRIPGALSPGAKLPGREADHSPPASAEVKKMWI